MSRSKTIAEHAKEAEEFLHELGRGIPDNERVIVSYAKNANVLADPVTGRKINKGFWPRTHKDGKFIPGGMNNYVCISSSIPTLNKETGKMRYWRGEASFGHGLAFFIDDVGDGVGSKGHFPLEEVKRRLPPTAVVETSPGNYQCWYFFDEPVDDMKRFKAFLNCFVHYVLEGAGGDVTIKDIARYGRMPCGFNNKRDNDGNFKYSIEGKHFAVNLIEADYSRRYSMEEIAEAFSFVIESIAQREIIFDSDDFMVCKIWLDMAVSILSRAKMGEGSDGAVVKNMSGKYRIRCPWGDQHTNGDPWGAYFRGPIPGADFDFVFGCAHDVCRKENKRTWSAFIDEIVMPVIEDRLGKANNYWYRC